MVAHLSGGQGVAGSNPVSPTQKDLESYENKVLSFMPDVGAEVVQRVLSDGENGQPHEIQILRFPSNAALITLGFYPREPGLSFEQPLAIWELGKHELRLWIHYTVTKTKGKCLLKRLTC